MFFGLGAWATPGPKQLQYLQGALVGFLKRVLRLTKHHVPAERVLMLAHTAEVRARLAIERLLYAQRLFRTGPAFLHHLIHQELACSDKSWLNGLRADLDWMENVNPGSLPQGWSQDMTTLFEWWQEPQTCWVRLVKKTWKLHLAQNAIIVDAKSLHAGIFHNLREAGATFTTAQDDFLDWEERHDCFCGKIFATRRGLLAHQRKAHALFSVERQFLQGCTCLHCGKFMWSTQRLQQHLAYIPKALGFNPCFYALQTQARQVPYEKEDVGATAAYAGLHRRECLQTAGPAINPCPVWETHRIQTLAELDECKQKLQIPHQPPDPVGEGEKIGEELSKATLCWFRQFYPNGPTEDEKALLVDAWVEVLCKRSFETEDDLDPWLEWVFLLWGEHWMPDLTDTLEDGVAEIDIDHIFADFASQLERYRNLARRAHLEHRLQLCVPPMPSAHRAPPEAGRTKHPKSNSKVVQKVPRSFADQTEWQQRVRAMHFLDLPPTRLCPMILVPSGEEAFLVVHLFSGRRRHQDVHAYLHEFGAERNLKLVVLSLDTAVSTDFGDLSLGSDSWQQLMRIYAAGAVSATLLGSPCETFSEARFTLPESLPTGGAPWPRPLRSAERLLGLDGLTARELKQCHLGGNFYQQGALVLSHHMQSGGVLVSEHPAKPTDAQRPSIWSSAIIEVLLRHPDAKLTHVNQYQWGASVVKPTGLLHYHMPNFRKDLYQHADLYASKPKDVAIGRDPSGQFRTSRHKEYPPRFCKGLAFSIVQALTAAKRKQEVSCIGNLPESLMKWIHGAARASTVMYRNTWLPDYQGT